MRIYFSLTNYLIKYLGYYEMNCTLIDLFTNLAGVHQT